MTRFIELHKVARDQRHVDPFASDDVNEPGAPSTPANEPQPVQISVDSIRCFYTRHADRGPGTRLTFKDGGGFAVTETYDEISAMVAVH